MTGKDALALEEEGRIEFDEERRVYIEVDEDGIFMQTRPTDDDRHDSDAEDLIKEEESHDPHAEMRDAGMSYADFLS
jgi:hypothetical protein